MAESTSMRGEGWGVMRPGDRRFHYYADGFSLCRRVGFYSGPLDLDTGKAGPQDCKACRKVLDRNPHPMKGD